MPSANHAREHGPLTPPEISLRRLSTDTSEAVAQVVVSSRKRKTHDEETIDIKVEQNRGQECGERVDEDSDTGYRLPKKRRTDDGAQNNVGTTSSVKDEVSLVDQRANTAASGSEAGDSEELNGTRDARLPPGKLEGSDHCYMAPLTRMPASPVRAMMNEAPLERDETHYVPVEFDLKLLQSEVQCILKSRAESVEYIGEGAHYEVYSFKLEDGRDVVARVARPLCAQIKTASEAATICYLREHTSIPIPEVLHVSADTTNRVGAEFLLQAKALGVPLLTVFDDLQRDERRTLTLQLTQYLYELYDQRFDLIGSLCEDASKCYRIGPTIQKEFVHSPGANGVWIGPFGDPKDYLLACIARERAASIAELGVDMEAGGTILSWHLQHIDNMEHFIQTWPWSSSGPRPYALSASDIKMDNIFVDPERPSQIVAIVDWEAVYTCPAWASAELPDWIVPTGPHEPERWPGEKLELSALSEAMFQEADTLDPNFGHLLRSTGYDDGVPTEGYLFCMFSHMHWSEVAKAADILRNMGYTEGWPDEGDHTPVAEVRRDYPNLTLEPARSQSPVPALEISSYRLALAVG